MNFYAFDFETANSARHSACSLALVEVKNKQIVNTYYTLIKPDTDFFWRNSQIHGIRPEDVADAPTFPEVWTQIANIFQPSSLLVAHNATFDCSVLEKCLEHYGLPSVNYRSLCTVRTSKKAFPDLANYQLKTVCSHLNISLLNHHNALADSLACTEILLEQEKQLGAQHVLSLVKSTS